MTKNLLKTGTFAMVGFLVSYVFLVILILVTNSRYIALACVNPALLIAASMIIYKRANDLLPYGNKVFLRFSVLYSMVAAFFSWLMLSILFSTTWGNQFVETLKSLAPQLVYFFLSVLICCSTIFALLKNKVKPISNKRAKTDLVGVVLSSFLTIIFGILLLWMASGAVTLLGG